LADAQGAAELDGSGEFGSGRIRSAEANGKCHFPRFRPSHIIAARRTSCGRRKRSRQPTRHCSGFAGLVVPLQRARGAFA